MLFINHDNIYQVLVLSVSLSANSQYEHYPNKIFLN